MNIDFENQNIIESEDIAKTKMLIEERILLKAHLLPKKMIQIMEIIVIIKNKDGFSISYELQPYPKWFKMLKPSRLNIPINFAWILSHFSQILNTLMWIGFNNLIHNDKSCKQNLSYLITNK